MSLNIPKVGEGFTYPIFLFDGSDALITDPSSVYASGDVTAYFGNSGTEVTIACARRSTTPILDIGIAAGQHTATPIILRIQDRSGAAFKTQWLTLFTSAAKKYKADTDFLYETDGADTVLRKAPLLKSGGLTTVGLWVEGP